MHERRHWFCRVFCFHLLRSSRRRRNCFIYFVQIIKTPDSIQSLVQDLYYPMILMLSAPRKYRSINAHLSFFHSYFSMEFLRFALMAIFAFFFAFLFRFMFFWCLSSIEFCHSSVILSVIFYFKSLHLSFSLLLSSLFLSFFLCLFLSCSLSLSLSLFFLLSPNPLPKLHSLSLSNLFHYRNGKMFINQIVCVVRKTN